MSKMLTILLLVIGIAPAIPQSNSVDSLKNLISQSNEEDTTLIIRQLLISIPYNFSKPDSGIYYATQAL